MTETLDTLLRGYESGRVDRRRFLQAVAALTAAGATPVRNHWIFFGSCAAAPEFAGFVANLIGVIETARKIITDPLGLTTKQFNDAIGAVRAACELRRSCGGRHPGPRERRGFGRVVLERAQP